MTCADLQIPEGLELLDDANATCVMVSTPSREVEEVEELDEGAEAEAAADAPAEGAA